MLKKKRQIAVVLCVSMLAFVGCSKSNIEEESLIALSQSASKSEHLATQGETKKLTLKEQESKTKEESKSTEPETSAKESEETKESSQEETQVVSQKDEETSHTEPISDTIPEPMAKNETVKEPESDTTQETQPIVETTTEAIHYETTEEVTKQVVTEPQSGVALTIEQAAAISTANYNEYYTYIVEVANLINQFRSENGLGAISLDYTNCIVAGIRSAEGAHLDYFSHERPDGTKVSTLINYYGINWDRCGENLGRRQLTPQEIVEGWKNSDAGHREIMLKTEWTSMGIGVAKDSEGSLYWTAVFIQN